MDAAAGCSASSERFILYNTGLVLCVTKSPIAVKAKYPANDGGGSPHSVKPFEVESGGDSHYTHNYFVLSPNAKQIAIFYTDNSALNKVIHLTKYIPTKYRSITVKIVNFRNRYCKRFPFLFERLYENSQDEGNRSSIFSQDCSSGRSHAKTVKLNVNNKVGNNGDTVVVTEMTLSYDEEDSCSSFVSFDYSVCDSSRREENDFNDYNYIYNITNDIAMSNTVMYTGNVLTAPKNSLSKAIADIISGNAPSNGDGSFDVSISDVFELDDEHNAVTAADVSSLFTEAFAEAPVLRDDHMYAISCGCAVVEMLNKHVFFLNTSLGQLVNDEYTVETDNSLGAAAASIGLKNEIFTLRKRGKGTVMNDAHSSEQSSFHLILLQNYFSSKYENDFSSSSSTIGGGADTVDEGVGSLEDFLSTYGAYCVRLLSLRNHVHSRKQVLLSYNGTIEQNRKYKHFISSNGSSSSGNSSKLYYNSYDNKYFDIINYNIFADDNLTKTIKTPKGSEITVIRNISNSNNYNSSEEDKNNIEVYKMNNEYNISNLFSFVRGSFVDSESSGGTPRSILTIDLRSMSVTGILSSGCMVTTTVKDCIDHNNRYSDLDISIFTSCSSSNRGARDRTITISNSMNLKDMMTIAKHVIEMLNCLNTANYDDEKMAALSENTRQITKKNSNIVDNSTKFIEINREKIKSFSSMDGSRIVSSANTSIGSASAVISSSFADSAEVPRRAMDRARMMEIIQNNKKQISENKSFVDKISIGDNTTD